MTAKVLAFYCHKGGVGKTTTTYHLAYKMAQMGKNILMVDADPQCNLTQLAVPEGEKITFSEKKNSLYSSLKSYMVTGTGNAIDPITPEKVNVDMEKSSKKPGKLDIIKGDLRQDDLEVEIYSAITTNIRRIEAYPAMLSASIRLFKEQYDGIFIDMSPSIGAMNQSLIMGADYFLMPLFLDLYSIQAIESLEQRIKGWVDRFARYREGKFRSNFALPKVPPKFIGSILSRYNVWGKKITKRAEMIDGKVKRRLAIFSESLFKINLCANPAKEGPVIGSVQDFNGLSQISQIRNKPVFLLKNEDFKDEEGKQIGSWGNDHEKIEGLNKKYTSLAKKIGKRCGAPLAMRS